MEKVQKLIQSYTKRKKEEVVFEQVRELLQTEEGLFAVSIRATNNFYMGTANGKPAAFLFTCREYADEFVKELRADGIESKSLEIRPVQRIAFFNDLYRSGFEAVMLDQNQKKSLAISLFSLVSKPESEEKMVMNPELMRAAICFYQGLASKQAIKEQQDWVCSELYKGRFIYPETTAHYSTVALLTDNRGRKFVPVFTDAVEFGKFDKKHHYQEKIVKFREFKKLLGKADGIVVNPFGFGLRLNLDKLNRIANENQTLKIVK